MPSEFLEKRHRAFLKQSGGTETVLYKAFDPESRDPRTGEVYDEERAYAETTIALPALVEFSPSQAIREKFGLDINLEAVIRIPAEDIAQEDISLKIGDAFILPGCDRQYYVKKIVKHMQARVDFLEILIALSRRIDRRG